MQRRQRLQLAGLRQQTDAALGSGDVGQWWRRRRCGQHDAPRGHPATLYLGDEVNRLKERLEDATTRECPSDHLVLLRRLSGMPHSTAARGDADRRDRGQAQKSADPQVAELAGRIVRVWKGQLAEHREQTKGAKRPAALSGAQRGGAR